MPALAFIRDNAAVIAIVALILALMFASEVRRAHRRMPFFRAAPGSTHDDPSRDARRGGVNSNHIGGVNP